jgi:formylglycine-generating enzyme required for sulfatase activity
MHGNVLEWCLDWYGKYPPGTVTDPRGPDGGEVSVDRGGSWLNHGWRYRSAYRVWWYPSYRRVNLGFRLSRGLPLRQSSKVVEQRVQEQEAAERPVGR